MTNNMDAKISARIAYLLSIGKSLPVAFDTVLGNGAYLKLASDLYDSFNAKA